MNLQARIATVGAAVKADCDFGKSLAPPERMVKSILFVGVSGLGFRVEGLGLRA